MEFTGDMYPDGSAFEDEYPTAALAGRGAVALHPEANRVVQVCLSLFWAPFSAPTTQNSWS